MLPSVSVGSAVSMTSACTSELTPSMTLGEAPKQAAPSDVPTPQSRPRSILTDMLLSAAPPPQIELENEELKNILHKLLRVNHARPARKPTLQVIEGVLGQRAAWGSALSVSTDVARVLRTNILSPQWATSMRSSLLYHAVLWQGGPTFFEVTKMNPPPSSADFTHTFEANLCGQGTKQRPVVHFVCSMLTFLLQVGSAIQPSEMLLYNNDQGIAVVTPNLESTDAAYASDTSVSMLMRCVAMQSYLTFLLSAADLPLLALDNELSIEVLDRVIGDAKILYVCIWRHIEKVLDSNFHVAYVMRPQDLASWRSLFRNFSITGARLSAFFQRLRNIAVDFTEAIPDLTPFPPEAADRLEMLVLERERRSSQKLQVPRARAPMPAAASNHPVLDSVSHGAESTPHQPSQDESPEQQAGDLLSPDEHDEIDSGFPRSESSPVTTSIGLTAMPFARPSAMRVDKIKEGNLTDDEHDSNDATVNIFDNQGSQSGAGRYAVGQVLGKGAFGTVYRAFDTEEGQFVAVKELQLASTDADSVLVRELKAEFEVLRKARHENIVSVQDLDTSIPGRPRIIMEWMPGGSVQSALKLTRTGFKEGVVAWYVKQALCGLAFLHSQNIVHRDIKPGNMLLSANGTLKLSDFGTSRIVNGIANSVQTGTVVGTIPYLAPECFKGTYSIGSDIWAIGCSALEMFTGRMPWSERGTKDTLSLVFIIGNAVPPDHHPQLPESADDEAESPLLPATQRCNGLQCGIGTISQCARDFLEQCFTYDHKERPSAEQLLLHPFVKDA